MKKLIKRNTDIIRLTFDQYDDILAQFDKISLVNVYPTLRQIELFEKEPSKWIIPCCYMYEKGKTPTTKEEEYRRKTLRQFIDTHLELYETEEEIVRASSNDTKK